MDESRWRKHVTWDDPDEIEAKYEELSSKIDTVLNPLSLDEFKSGLDGLKNSESKARPPSKFLQKKHDKIVQEIQSIQSSSSDLHWGDIITNSSVKDFLKQYFPRSLKIQTKEFLGFLEFEFPTFLNSEALREELVSLLSVDKNSKYISINALELLTRDFGLENFVQDTYERVELSLKESKNVINEQILQEVTEIKVILDKRTAELDRREARIANRESKVLKLENMLLTDFKEKLEKMAAAVREKLAKEINTQMKRMQGLERNVNDLVKLARSKQQSLTRSELSCKSSSDPSSKLKARISSLEKSNEVLKTKLSLFEQESKLDKSKIHQLQEELTRLKARSSMLEQSLSCKKEPEKIVEVQVVKEEPEKKVKIIEPTIFISLLSTFIKCFKLSLPELNQPASPRSMRVSVLEEENTIGELFYPAFNKIVPILVEAFPFIYKHKNKDEQFEIIHFMWSLLINAWNSDVPREGQRFHPVNLPFDPTCSIWKQKLANLKKKPKRQPVYSLFSNQMAHKVVSFYLLKWVQDRSHKKTALVAAFLLSLLSVSQKKLLQSLAYIKETLDDQLEVEDLDQFVQVIVYFLDSPDDLSTISCEILLALTVNSLNLVINQCCSENAIFKISEAFKKALMTGQKMGCVTEQEESLTVLVQKLSSNEYLQSLFKNQNLLGLVQQRAQGSGLSSFFQSNLSSIIRNLSN